jgi:hypothetical protein
MALRRLPVTAMRVPYGHVKKLERAKGNRSNLNFASFINSFNEGPIGDITDNITNYITRNLECEVTGSYNELSFWNLPQTTPNGRRPREARAPKTWRIQAQCFGRPRGQGCFRRDPIDAIAFSLSANSPRSN